MLHNNSIFNFEIYFDDDITHMNQDAISKALSISDKVTKADMLVQVYQAREAINAKGSVDDLPQFDEFGRLIKLNQIKLS